MLIIIGPMKKASTLMPAVKIVIRQRSAKTALSFIEKYAGPTAKELEVQHDTDMFEQEPLPSWVDKEKVSTFMGQQNHHFWFFERYGGIPVAERLYMVSVPQQQEKLLAFRFLLIKKNSLFLCLRGLCQKKKRSNLSYKTKS